jgi:hypothetical protein
MSAKYAHLYAKIAWMEPGNCISWPLFPGDDRHVTSAAVSIHMKHHLPKRKVKAVFYARMMYLVCVR